jgi:hypothetical protein
MFIEPLMTITLKYVTLKSVFHKVPTTFRRVGKGMFFVLVEGVFLV